MILSKYNFKYIHTYTVIKNQLVKVHELSLTFGLHTKMYVTIKEFIYI